MPAKAGIYRAAWTPAFAGVTGGFSPPRPLYFESRPYSAAAAWRLSAAAFSAFAKCSSPKRTVWPALWPP